MQPDRSPDRMDQFVGVEPDAVFEYDIAFIKVLLGVNPETSLCLSEGLIADTDKLEAEALLGAAITHWPALKNTSIAGLCGVASGSDDAAITFSVAVA